MKRISNIVATIGLTLAFSFYGMPISVAYAQSVPSFDCNKASNYLEIQICQSKKLSALDVKLDTSYKTLLDKLSPPGRKSLRSDQLLWLAFAKKVCDPVLRANVDNSVEDCISQKLQTRDQQLRMTNANSDAVTIFPISKYIAKRNSENSEQSGYDIGFNTVQISYPQIDGPDSPLKLKFNKTHAAFVSEVVNRNPEETDTDYFADYRILGESSNLLAIEVSGGFYAHGTPHGQYYSLMFNWLLREGRELRATDIFDPSKPWRHAIVSFCYKGLIEQIKQFEENTDAQSFEKDFRSVVTNPERWTIDSKGIRVHFLIYEVAAYIYGQPEVLVTWDQLRKYLAPNAELISIQ